MFKNRRKAALIPFVLFIIVFVVVLAVVSSRPYDRPVASLSNSFGNAMNGSCVAKDGSLIYYIDGNGVLRCKGESETNYRISGKASYAFPYSTGVVYVANSQLRFSQFTGGEPTILQDNVDSAQVSGNWVFYSSDGNLYKYRIKDKKQSPLNIKAKQYAVVGTYTYYIAEDDYLYICKNDGSNSQKFLDEKMTQFQIFGDYIFYLNKNGDYCKTSTGNASFSNNIIKGVEQFVVNDSGVVMYYDGKALYSKDLTDEKASVIKVQTEYKSVRNINYVDDNFYFYDNDVLYSIKTDGAEQTKM